MGYLIYKPADTSLDEIWRYSLAHWGSEKAEEYIYGLFEVMEKAAAREVIWRSVKTETGLNAFCVKYKSHFIFFRELDEDAIGVINIIHERRDMISILERDLKRTNRIDD